ncbi:MAG TPA: hydrogenase formation protein HypD, partial [bacterium]|nr:hydrogenase formation protein HypD [bacterium]
MPRTGINEKKEAARLIDAVKARAEGFKRPVNIMEICGTHTMDISRYGLRRLLPKNINLISGPGCPVCVCPIEEIDRAVEISMMPGVITATFGDMMRVPGTRETLNSAKMKGADIRVVYSPEDAVDMAAQNPEKKVVFLGIGFETTAPAVAVTVRDAKKKGIKNFFVLPMFKTVIPPMEALLSDEALKLDGFIAPGHVSAIIGAKPYEYLTEKYKKPCVITGFEALD